MKFTTLALALTVLPLPSTLSARQPTYYQHLTDVEAAFNQMGCDGHLMFFGDSMNGPVRSNDTIRIKYRAYFLDQLISSAPGYYFTSGNYGVYNRYEPIFNAPAFPIPDDMPHLRERASETYFTDNGRYIITIVFNNRDGANVYERRLGIFGEDRLIDILSPDERHIVWVDGAVDVEGIVFGQYTIFAAGPIGLLDDLRYPEASDRTAEFDERRTTPMIGLVSMGDILVRNTVANGRNFNEDEDWDDYGRHSIMINGALIALGGSFTYDQPERRGGGDAWIYDRGTVYTKGSVVQRTRGALRYNTGYYWNKKYDHRLRTKGPPGLDPSEYPIIREDYERLDLKPYKFEVYSSLTNSLIMRQGGSLRLRPDATLDVRNSLVLHGTPDQPLEVTLADRSARISLSSASGYVDLQYVRIGAGISLEVSTRECRIADCDIEGRVSVEGSVEITGSRFGSLVRIIGANEVLLDHVVLEDGVIISANSDEVVLSHCTVAGSNAAGVRLRGNCRGTITNSIVAFNGQGVVVEGRAAASIIYSDVFSSDREDLVSVDLGEGSFSLDPGFVDLDLGDLHLREGSPCIDAGDPDSPRDPDGTRADIGAFWYEQGLAVEQPPPASPFDRRRGDLLSASPNPFNSSTVIRFQSAQSAQSAVRLSIYNLSGRKVFSTVSPPRLTASGGAADYRKSAEGISFTWDASSYPAGIYISRYANGTDTYSIKLVKVD